MNHINIFNIAKRNKRPLILDGAMGSLLQQKGLQANESLWMSKAIFEHPDLIENIHKDYIASGADIITTNTFRTNPTAIKKTDLSSENLVKKAVSLARKAKNDKHVYIAGSNAPAEDCYQAERFLTYNELQINHRKHIDLLALSGCDFIWNETQSHWDEIEIICQYCSAKNYPFIISLFFTNELKLLSGEDLFEAVDFIRKFNPLTIGFNCIRPETFEKVLDKIPNDINWGFYLNCGSGNYQDEIISCGIDENEYLEIIKNWIKPETLSTTPLPSFIGACCGSNPGHIKQIKNYLDGIS